MKLLTILLLLLGTLFLAYGETSKDPKPKATTDSSHISPLAAYQKGDFDLAEKEFRKKLESHPNNASLLYNWGLSLYKIQNRGLAVAAWRKAVAISPFFEGPRLALKFAAKEMPALQANQNGEAWPFELNKTLLKISLGQVGGLSLISFLIAGFYLLKYFGRRKFALIEEKPLPQFPNKGVIAALVTVVLISLTGLKISDVMALKATVTSKKVSAFSGPSQEDNELVELTEGMEVVVLLQKEDWTHIEFVSGQSGWVPTQSLFLTSGYQLW